MSEIATVAARPDPVRLAFARIEGWKAACLLVVLLACLLPSGWVDHESPRQSFRRQEASAWTSGWYVLGRSPSFRSVLPWIVVKVLVAHALLAWWFRRRGSSRLTATETILTWGLSTVLDAFIVWAASDALVDYCTRTGNPLAWDAFGGRHRIEYLITPTSLLFAEAWLGLAVLAFALGPLLLYRAMRERSRVESLGTVEGTPKRPSRIPRTRIILLAVALLAFLALPWVSTRRLDGWRAIGPPLGRAPGFTYLLGEWGSWQRDGASLMAIAILALIGTAWIGRVRVDPRDRGTYVAVLCGELVCLAAWGAGIALLAHSPFKWLRPLTWKTVTEVAPFLVAQLFAICCVETLWFGLRRRPADTTDRRHPLTPWQGRREGPEGAARM